MQNTPAFAINDRVRLKQEHFKWYPQGTHNEIGIVMSEPTFEADSELHYYNVCYPNGDTYYMAEHKLQLVYVGKDKPVEKLQEEPYAINYSPVLCPCCQKCYVTVELHKRTHLDGCVVSLHSGVCSRCQASVHLTLSGDSK